MILLLGYRFCGWFTSSCCFCLVLQWKHRTPMWAHTDTRKSPLIIIYLASFSIQVPRTEENNAIASSSRSTVTPNLSATGSFIFTNGHSQHQLQQQQQQSRMACRKKAFPATQAILPQQCSELEQDNQAFHIEIWP